MRLRVTGWRTNLFDEAYRLRHGKSLQLVMPEFLGGAPHHAFLYVKVFQNKVMDEENSFRFLARSPYYNVGVRSALLLKSNSR